MSARARPSTVRGRLRGVKVALGRRAVLRARLAEQDSTLRLRQVERVSNLLRRH